MDTPGSGLATVMFVRTTTAATSHPNHDFLGNLFLH